MPAVRRFFEERGHNHAHVLSVSPPVVYLWWGRDDTQLHVGLAERDLTVLYLFPWSFSSEEVPAIAQYVTSMRRRFHKHRIIFLCNEEYAVEELRKAGLDAEFIHQNAFINEDVFCPRPAIARTHDAIYSASLAPYKRHSLAASVSSLVMLSYTYGGSSSSDYANSVRKVLSHAWWAKESRSDKEKISTEEIVDLYARAHVGLCLSSIEGGMFVSMEYMLCGLGVVSTQSTGGRAAFWDDRYVIVCGDGPEEVAEAVRELKSRQLDPWQIRAWTLEKIAPHRERMRRLLSSLGAEAEIPWMPGSHGITTHVRLATVAGRLAAPCLGNHGSRE